MTTSSSEPHDVLSSLARLVSATIRDKVVLEQMDELSSLRSRLESSRRVSITGPNGRPVLAEGSLTDGVFDDEANDEDGGVGALWTVGLRTSSDDVGGNDGIDDCGDDGGNDRNTTVPLGLLSYIEIRIGGIVFSTSEDIEGTKLALGLRKGNAFDTHNRPEGMDRSAVCEFHCGRYKTAFLTFHMTDFPKGDWRSLRSLNMHNRSVALRNEERQRDGGDYYDTFRDMVEEEQEEDSESMDMYRYITERLATQHPRQRAELTSVSFNVGSVRDAVKGITRGSEFEVMKERYLSD